MSEVSEVKSWWQKGDALLFLFLVFCIGTCTAVSYVERQCMMKCTRPINECERVCKR